MIVRLVFMVAAALAGVAACGDGGRADRETLVRVFVQNELPRAQAECLADRAAADMDPELFAVMVEAAKSNDDSLAALEPAELARFGQFMSRAGIDCATEMLNSSEERE